ncbi:MAG: sensor c-di-GMP phosphodiesterase-like protein [Gammaproteobacteria bacterium]
MEQFGLSSQEQSNIGLKNFSGAFHHTVMECSACCAIIAIAIVALGHSLRLNVVAEGAETEAQFDYS